MVLPVFVLGLYALRSASRSVVLPGGSDDAAGSELVQELATLQAQSQRLRARLDQLGRGAPASRGFACPPAFPYLRPWKNEPGNPLWCYRHEAADGAACNIVGVADPPDGTFGFSDTYSACPSAVGASATMMATDMASDAQGAPSPAAAASRPE